MKKRQDILRQLDILTDIRGVVGSLKTLAQVEISRSARDIERQQKIVADLDELLAQALSHLPRPAALSASARGGVLIAIGAERGFCGGFNTALAAQVVRAANDQRRILVVGRRLAATVTDHCPDLTRLQGPGSLEDVDEVMAALLESLTSEFERPQAGPAENVTVAFNREHNGQPELQVIAPFQVVRALSAEPAVDFETNLAAPVFLQELLRHYLGFFLRAALLESYLAENRQRYLHLEAGLGRLDRSVEELTLKSRRLRQEEITQEIEVILLTSVPREG